MNFVGAIHCRDGCQSRLNPLQLIFSNHSAENLLKPALFDTREDVLPAICPKAPDDENFL